MNKSEVRKKILTIRKKSSYKNLEINFNQVLKIFKKNYFSNIIIGGYYPYNFEVDAIKILEKFENLGHQISLPKIKKKSQMDFFSWSTKDPLSINKYGIPEPITSRIKYPDILLIPLVAFDNNLNRIGYGEGSYDRYIKKIKKIKQITTIGLAYSFQEIKKITPNKYDMKLDYIVTEKHN